MAELLLGPVLRYVDPTQATLWVETDAPCDVDVLGHTARTFTVEGRHYALVIVDGLEPGSSHPYEVRLDGARRWPEDGSPFPPSTIRTPAEDEPARIAFGSCRVSVPHEPPYTLRKEDDDRGREIDALYALALRMRDEPEERWPNRLLLLGDQVYADEVSPRTLEYIERKRGTDEPPGEQVADLDEYVQLYRESWGEPTMRWLISTLATATIFDDHDVHDDWNISGAWVEDIRREPWWDERIVGAFVSYWIYQHLGNLSPEALEEDELWCAVRDSGGADCGPMLREFGRRADREQDGSRWSYCRDYGGVRVMVIDSRAGRDFRDGRRQMVDDDEWGWICERLTGGHDHLVIATSLPLLLGHGMHFFEAWNEAVCDGAWGKLAARLGEKLRRAVDLEHWAAFDSSFRRLTDRIREVAAGEHGPPPASITVLSGDVHHAYLAEVAFRREAGAQSAVWQAVCSPVRNPLDARERRTIRFGGSRVAHVIGRALARSAGVKDPDLRWRICEGPWFDNQIATLTLHERSASIRLERTRPAEDSPDGRVMLEECFSRRLA
ncbi:MAG TPA: alkaline phosphatase D family protein [Solirubrobacteraceae bacterium]|nr:alkaline phosphatase D family protein [Solirubrobacteraceae bacterium]